MAQRGYRELGADQLRRVCDPDSFDFSSTAELPTLKGLFNQPRAMQGLSLGISSSDKSFHIRVIQPEATSRGSALKQVIEDIADNQYDGTSVQDFCYVHNFENPASPSLLTFPRGLGREFVRSMQELESALFDDFPVKFIQNRVPQYASLGQKIGKDIITSFVDAINKDVPKVGIEFLLHVVGPSEDGSFTMLFTVRSIDDTKKFPVEQEINDTDKLSTYEELVIWLDKYYGEKKDIGDAVIASFLKADKIHDQAVVLFQEEFLTALEEWDANYVADFLGKHIRGIEERFPVASSYIAKLRDFFFEIHGHIVRGEKDEYAPFFQVNLVVDSSAVDEGTVPVIWEDDPTFRNLFGTVNRNEVDRDAHSHTHNRSVSLEQSNHMNLEVGSLLFANGGVLIIPMWKFIRKNDFDEAWEVFTTALRNEEVAIQDLATRLSMITIDELRPEKIPLNVRVVLITDHYLDSVFSSNAVYSKDYSLFGVKAEFISQAPRNKKNEVKLAQFLGTCSRREGISHCDSEAVAVFVEYASQLAESQKKLTLDFAKIKYVLIESYAVARERSKSISPPSITASDVRNAISNRAYRSNSLEDRIREMTQEGILKTVVRGRKIGRINALSVYSTGDAEFGRACTLTASTSWGSGSIINVDRVSGLAGDIQIKSVLEVEGYIRETFGRTKRLSMRSQIVFEQIYGGIDGDSAAAAEMYVILSSLAQIPINQNIAITGSCTQKGIIQAVGGVNTKIEGFFDTCKVLGRGRLNGKQGVVIPHDVRNDLMLREDIVEAVRAGRFHIWTIRHIDEGAELLFDMSAIQMHDEINKALDELSNAFSSEKKEETKDKDEKEKGE